MNGITFEKPILTISIPTYNRPEQIQKQVRALLPQLNFLVVLVVRDNCSSIPVESLFLDEELKSFIIERNKVNIGGDANIVRCLEMCNTKWLWTLGDDDFVSCDAIEIIIDAINTYNDALWLNFSCTENVTLYGFDEFVINLNNPTAFADSFWMSKCVYNIDELQNFIFFYYKNLSAMIGSLIMLLKYLRVHPDAKMVRLHRDIFEYHSTAISWSFTDFIRYTGIVFDSFNKSEKKALKKNLLKVLTIQSLNGLSSDVDDVKYLFRVLIARYGFFSSLYSFPISLLKRLFLINLTPCVYKKIVGVKRVLGMIIYKK